MTWAAHRLVHPPERLRYCSSPNLKVSRDNRRYLPALPHSGLTSCQQLHKVNLIAGRKGVNKVKEVTWAELRLHPDIRAAI
jgi:hypothetical protein